MGRVGAGVSMRLQLATHPPKASTGPDAHKSKYTLLTRSDCSHRRAIVRICSEEDSLQHRVSICHARIGLTSCLIAGMTST